MNPPPLINDVIYELTQATFEFDPAWINCRSELLLSTQKPAKDECRNIVQDVVLPLLSSFFALQPLYPQMKVHDNEY